MKIEQLSLFAAFLMTQSLACGSPEPVIAPIPIEAQLPILIPNEQSVRTYARGAIANYTGAVDIAVLIPTLERIDADEMYGIKLPQDSINITYLLPQSLQNEPEKSQSLDLVRNSYSLIAYQICREQGICQGRMRFTLISVPDELTAVISRNPRRYGPNDPFWKTALSLQLTLSYVGRGRLNITDISDTPPQTPNLTPEERNALAHNIFFSVTRLDPGFFLQYAPARKA